MFCFNVIVYAAFLNANFNIGTKKSLLFGVDIGVIYTFDTKSEALLPYVHLHSGRVSCSMLVSALWLVDGEHAVGASQAWPVERQSCNTCWKNPAMRQRS